VYFATCVVVVVVVVADPRDPRVAALFGLRIWQEGSYVVAAVVADFAFGLRKRKDDSSVAVVAAVAVDIPTFDYGMVRRKKKDYCVVVVVVVDPSVDDGFQ